MLLRKKSIEDVLLVPYVGRGGPYSGFLVMGFLPWVIIERWS